MTTAEERFWAKVRRRNGHDIWTGFADHRGVGQVRIDGKLRTAQRAAWEFTHGPLPDGVRVNTCPTERACVRIDHLSLDGPTQPAPPPGRRQRGTGSMRELRHGVWQLTVTEGSTLDGTPIRRYRTIHGNERDAAAALESLVALVQRDVLGDLRVHELIGRYLHAHHDPSTAALARDRAVLDDIIEPALPDHLAATITREDIKRFLAAVYRTDGTDQCRITLGLLRDAYRWAHHQGWMDHDPTVGVTLRAFRRASSGTHTREAHSGSPAGAARRSRRGSRRRREPQGPA